MVTITDIAKRAGVAKSTVSNALTGKKYVSEDLKNKILDICNEMNYSPNFYASRLSGNKTNIVSLFLEDSDKGVYHSFYTELIESCLKYLSKHGYHLLISYNSDAKMKNRFLQKGKAPVDGAIIMAPTVNDQRIMQFKSDFVPCVSIGKPDQTHSVSYVDVDNFKLVSDAVNILAINGYKNIYLLNSNDTLNISRERTTAFLKALKENDLSGGIGNVNYSTQSSMEDGLAFALEKIDEGTAFVTANVKLAEGVYAAAAQKNLKIGENVGVFALGGKKNEEATPNLAYATQDYAKLAKMAAKTLLKQLKKAEGGEVVENEISLIPSKMLLDASVSKKKN